MKKILLAVAMCLFVGNIFAQSEKNAIGLRLGYGAELQYERYLSSHNFLKVNGGLYGFDDSFFGTCTYNWKCCDWSNWTPSAGNWFLSAGVGGALGAYKKDFNVGIAGDVAFGIEFKGAPFTLAVDYRPTLFFMHDSWGKGFGGVALSCVYRF